MKKPQTLKVQLKNMRTENAKLKRYLEIEISDIKEELVGIGALFKRFNEIFSLHSVSFNQKLDSHFNMFCREALKIKENQWISIKDKYPEEGDNVLTLSNDDIQIGFLYYDDTDPIDCSGLTFRDHQDNHDIDFVTHWMPLPKLPNMEK